MSIQDLEKEVEKLSPAKRDRLAAFLSYLRSKESDDNISGEEEEFVNWKDVRGEFLPESN